jgi:hypothetical protein
MAPEDPAAMRQGNTKNRKLRKIVMRLEGGFMVKY